MLFCFLNELLTGNRLEYLKPKTKNHQIRYIMFPHFSGQSLVGSAKRQTKHPLPKLIRCIATYTVYVPEKCSSSLVGERFRGPGIHWICIRELYRFNSNPFQPSKMGTTGRNMLEHFVQDIKVLGGIENMFHTFFWKVAQGLLRSPAGKPQKENHLLFQKLWEDYMAVK